MISRLIIPGGIVQMRLSCRQWRACWETHNLIVDAGRVLAAQLLYDPAAVPVSYGAIGDGNTTPAVAQTALQGTEHQRIALVKSNSSAVVVYEATFTGVGSPVNVQEAGLFNTVAAGTMFARWLTTPFTLPVGATFYFKWTSEVARET